MLEMARKYVAKGKSVIPLRPRSKVPAISSWAPYQDRLATDEELVSWFGSGANNMGLVTGAISGLVVVDEDSAEGAENATKLGLTSPVRAQARKGFHHYFKHPGTKVSNGVRIAPGLDLRGDGGYVVAPPSIHETGHVYCWAIAGEMPVYPGYMPDVPVVVNREGWVTDAVNSLEAGNRHGTLVKIVGKLIHEGLSESETLALLMPHLEAMREEGVAEDPVVHARKIIAWASAQEKQNAPAQASSEWTMFSLKDIMSSKPVDWLIRDLIPKKSITWFFGNQSTGKSWVTMDLAIRLSEPSAEWLTGAPLPKQRVLYIDEESSTELMGLRMRLLTNKRDVDAENVKFVVRQGCDLLTPAGKTAFDKAVTAHRPDVVIMDSYSCFHTGNDNDSEFTTKMMNMFKRIVDKYGVTLIIVDHMSSGAASRLYFDKNAGTEVVSNDVAGNKIKVRQADVGLCLVDRKDGTMEIQNVKPRFGAKQAPVVYRLSVTADDARLVPETLMSDATEF